MTPRRSPLLSFDRIDGLESSIVFNPKMLPENPESNKKRWYYYLPLCGTLLLILAPHPSLLYVLVDFHLQTLEQPYVFLTHLLATYTLTFLAFSSLIVCLARDPGPANPPSSRLEGANGDAEEEIGINEALMGEHDDASSPLKWCSKCWAPKSERTHHCSVCNSLDNLTDHHCPWIGAKCIGHRTYPAFVHFLCCLTLLSLYVGVMAIHALWYAFNHPFAMHEYTPVHELVLAFMGGAYFLIIGSFAAYHIYLIYTNQTTIENITPFMLLRHLPSLPRDGHNLSDPPTEEELSRAQRRLVRDAHGQILLYDLGWRKNFEQVFGWKKKGGWAFRVWCGGASLGDGRTFVRNPKAYDMLGRLARELVKTE